MVYDFRHLYRVLMDPIRPGIGVIHWFELGNALPDSTVALKTTPKCQLPNSVSLLQPALCLKIAQTIPDRGRRGVTKPIEQLQVLLDTLNHRFASCMDAEMLKGFSEVWN
ncbi:hypothetical protein RJ641_020738, partial [Dillenia turbinata]